MEREDLIYTAGFFDADGSVGVYWFKNRGYKRGGRYLLTVCISQKIKLFLFVKLTESFGGLTYYNKANKCWHYRIQGRKALAFLEAICPFSCNKQEQIRLAIEFQSKITWHGCTPITDEEFNRRKQIADKIKELKK